ncbi:metal ABC transporter solute-binding protein, Zn/Mn family [Cohnella rhizosphaerae]|uniref:Zinc ABC transporter substrate-binding protein n=1 Tax=Cohnella rhizosphaerae TaxID=1457232 RepID=A0A9X4QW39_9BACL|nr:zinc ABC transporter substrate-binding protein [Cohnella rhizosphaerae]MDG0813415.1 zinc ABC transporter substrate-binding protein [Cohnella rhizosphaerae]
MLTKRLERVAMVFLFLAILVALNTACANGGDRTGENGQSGKIRIVTTIAQIAEPLAVIGGDKVAVDSLMGPGVDPHLYAATQGDIKKLQSGDIVFYSGLHLEANMVKVFEQIGKERPVLAIGETLPKERLLKDPKGATDPHIWFDIDLWKQALGAATEELKKYSEADAAYFEANKKAYFEQLDALKAEALEKLGRIPAERRVLVTAHDAFGYFGRLLGLQVIGLQGLSTEDEIGLSDIEKTIDLLVDRGIPAVFVESSINPASIEAVVEGAKKRGHDVRLGGQLYSDAMGAGGTAEGTYLGMYRHNVDTIGEALASKEG